MSNISPTQKNGEHIITTFADAREAIKTRDATLHRHTVTAAKLRIDADELVGCDDRFRLTRDGITKLCEGVGAPSKYLLDRQPKP